MRPPLSTIDARRFDVAVIGAGVNGASAAQHLAGAGYSVLLVDKGDFCSDPAAGRAGYFIAVCAISRPVARCGTSRSIPPG